MGGMVNSVGGLLGFDTGPKAPAGQFGAQGLNQLQGQNDFYNNNVGQFQGLMDYANGTKSADDALNKKWGEKGQEVEQANALATNPLTGSKFATEQVQNNPMLSGIYGRGGAMQNMAGNLNNELGQGYQLQPEDQTMYGQTSGNIARQFGQQGNQAANDLASRGLSSSGAAGAQFSGLAGNKNEMLAQAQQNIMQQRFQNTMSQASTLNQMGLGAQQAINQQYGRQQAGVNDQKSSELAAANAQMGNNSSQNSYNLDAAKFNAANTPTNIADIGIAAGANAIGAGGAGGGGLFGGSKKKPGAET